jgi:hypothetical protein
VRIGLDKLRVRGIALREGRGGAIASSLTDCYVQTSSKAISEKGGGLSGAAKRDKKGDSALHREF